MRAMQLITLGRLQLEPDVYQRPKLLLLLCYLVLEGGRSRDHLRTLFWPHASDPSANLRVALAQLRVDLPGAVRESGNLLSTGIACDAVELLEAFEGADLSRTVALYQGTFLDGSTASEWGVELEEWVLTTREFLAGRVVEAHLRLAEMALGFAETASIERHAIAAHHVSSVAPLDTDTLTRLHQLLASINHPLVSDVRREALEFGLNLEYTPSAKKPLLGPSNLPAPVDAFVARHAERQQLSSLLDQAETRLITVVGPGGVGKSRLVLEVARDLHQANRFADGVFIIYLEVLESPQTVAGEMLRALQMVGSDDP